VDLEATGSGDGAGAGADAEGGAPRPVFMEIYADEARAYMERSGATAADFAAVAAKATANGSRNPFAQVRTALTVEEVLAARTIVDPLTRPMCSSIGDGAAALVLCSPEHARHRGLRGARVRASVVAAGWAEGTGDVVERAVATAYGKAGVGPGDLDVVEVHDAAAPAELIISEQLGLAGSGDGPRLIRNGSSSIGGRRPVNPSGGLLARGHPIGATGAAQLVELTMQLRGRAGDRQVPRARIGLAENAGGSLGNGPAACTVTILEAFGS
jgi:acetyl-CoA acetyltransferase